MANVEFRSLTRCLLAQYFYLLVILSLTTPAVDLYQVTGLGHMISGGGVNND